MKVMLLNSLALMVSSICLAAAMESGDTGNTGPLLGTCGCTIDTTVGVCNERGVCEGPSSRDNATFYCNQVESVTIPCGGALDGSSATASYGVCGSGQRSRSENTGCNVIEGGTMGGNGVCASGVAGSACTFIHISCSEPTLPCVPQVTAAPPSNYF